MTLSTVEVSVMTKRSHETGPKSGLAHRRSPAISEEGTGRDTGPVSARNSSKGALVAEAHAVFHALADGKILAEVRTACLAGKLLRQSARETRRRIWQSLDWRYFSWNPPRWMLADLTEAAKGDVTDRRFVGLAYLHYARRDRLTFGCNSVAEA